MFNLFKKFKKTNVMDTYEDEIEAFTKRLLESNQRRIEEFANGYAR